MTFGDLSAFLAGCGGVRGLSTVFFADRLGLFCVGVFLSGVGVAGPKGSRTFASLMISSSGLFTPKESLKNVKLSIVNSFVFTVTKNKIFKCN